MMNVSKGQFGSLNGTTINSYTVTTGNGMEITCIDYGCIITSIKLPDREGNQEEVVLGFDTIEEYVDHSPFFGCTSGRNAGRIEDASIELDGVEYSLAKNDGDNNLHSGPNGFHNVVWNSTTEVEENKIDIVFSYTSPDGEG